MTDAAFRLRCREALLPDGWAEDVVLTVRDGRIAAVEAGGDAAGAETLPGPVLPGLANLHSHIFQRGMAGLAERRAAQRDTFWSWREVMYLFLSRLTPDDVEAIAAQGCVEMLESGFTALGEFHYLHHRPDGGAYDDPAEMAARVAAAAADCGIGLTLLPVFYAHGNFGGAAPNEGQRRFICDRDGFARLFEASRSAISAVPDAALGVAPHSLRAVSPDELRDLVATHPEGPLHIHVAEQVKEVEDCLAWAGVRPMRWLLDNADVDARWCVIHATHMDEGETADLARTGAVVGLCPVTEANLGDGVFRAVDYAAAGGRIGVGTDSNIRISVADELRSMEYAQRLARRARNVLAVRPGSTGRQLYDRALAGGAQALARDIGAIAPGMRADLVVLDGDSPALAGAAGDAVLDGWIFAGDRDCVRETWVGGRRVVADGRHPGRDAVAARFRAVVARLVA